MAHHLLVNAMKRLLLVAVVLAGCESPKETVPKQATEFERDIKQFCSEAKRAVNLIEMGAPESDRDLQMCLCGSLLV